MKFLKTFSIFIFISFLAICCGNSSDSGNGTDTESDNCDVIANADGPRFFKVVNNLSTGLEWTFINSFPFGADMKPGECTLFGLEEGSYTVEFKHCNISDAACSSSFGSTIRRTFTIGSQKNHTILVNDSFF